MKRILLCITILIFIISCGNSYKPSGKLIYESEDKKIKVYESEVDYELDKLIEASGYKTEDISDERKQSMKLDIIKDLILRKAIVEEGKNQKYNSGNNYLQGQNSAIEQYLASYTLSEKFKNIDITDAQIEEVYNQNKEMFTRQDDTIKLELVTLKKNQDEQISEAILSESLANPEDFANIAAKYQNPSTLGETADIPLTQLESQFPNVAEAVKDVNVGEIVDKVVSEGDDLYVIRVLSKLAKGPIPLEEVKTDIKARLIVQEKQDKINNFFLELSSKYGINNINSDIFNK